MKMLQQEKEIKYNMWLGLVAQMLVKGHSSILLESQKIIMSAKDQWILFIYAFFVSVASGGIVATVN